VYVYSTLILLRPILNNNYIHVQIANDIRQLLHGYTKAIPTILEIPSKDQPYNPDKDYIMQRVNLMLGGSS
jgi:V-type H+-transporting ATPase subunit F